MKNVNDPGNTHQSVLDFDFDDVTAVEVVKVHAVHWHVLNPMPFAPASYNQAPARQRSAHREFSDHAGLFDLRRDTVKCSIGQHQGRENPGKRDEAVIYALERFEFQMPQRTALQPNGQAQRQEEQQADKNQDAIELKWRVAIADSHKCERAQDKERRTVQQFLAKREFRLGRIQAARIADLRVALRSAIQAVGHFTVRTLDGGFARQTMFSSRPLESSWQSISWALRTA